MKRSLPKWYDTLLFVALLSGPPKLRARDPLQSLENVVDWAVLLNFGVWLFGALWVLARFGNDFVFNKRLPAFPASVYLGFAFVCALLLSMLTSNAPLLTLYRTVQVGIALLFCFHWIDEFGVDNALRHLFWGLVFCVSIILVVAAIDPDSVFASNRLMGGVWGSAGSVAALGCVVALTYPATRAWLRWVSLVIFFAILVFSMTRAAYAAVLVPLLVAAMTNVEASAARRVFWLLVAVITMALVFEWSPGWADFLLRDPESLATLSDRVPLWAYLLDELWRSSPWLGLGFFAIRDVALAYNPGLGSAHSGYVEVLAGAGIFGLFAYGAVLFYQLGLVVRLLRHVRISRAAFAAINLLVAVMLLGVTSEDSIIASPVSFTFWLTAAMLPILAQQKSDRSL